ncbi:MAG: phage virion morphogenesis protein [Desulfovibrionaceae bacterium]|nr:phage virion morphogenesis protein [Desulfovibrionaceae bacterium]
MAGINITVNISALQPLQAKLRGLAGMDTRALMPRLGEYLLRSTQERFKTETGPDGIHWAALKPKTLKYKKKNRDKILTLSGALQSRWLHYEATATQAVIYNNAIYAATHQFGRGPIPARPFLGISHQDAQEINAITRDWLEEQL